MNNCGVGFADILYFVRFANSIIINYSFFILHLNLVGSRGLEPPTSRLSGVRSNHLSYEPKFRSLSLPCELNPKPFRLALVEIIGIEPMTPCLQSRCSPS